MSKLTKELNCCIVFYPDFFFIQDLFTGKVKEIGEEEDGLYMLKNQDRFSHRSKSFVAARRCEDEVLWHQRLGHVPLNVIRKISMLKLNKSSVMSHCDVCPLARQIRLPFHASSNRSTRCFDLIHMDVWGPYKVSTHNNMRFFLTLVDDHSRWTWVFLLHLKSDVSTILRQFILMVKTQFDI